MSWRVDGSEYHSYVEYQQALARHHNQRLRRMVERLEIPPADTHRLEEEVAAAQARQRAVARLSAQVQLQASERQEALDAQRREVSQAFAEIAASEGHLLRDLEGFRVRLVEKIHLLEEQRRTAAETTATTLERELATDRRDAERASRRRHSLLAEAEQTLSRWSESRLGALGLDSAGIAGLLDRARRADAVEGLELARRAHDQVQALDVEATFREAKLKSLREVYRAEVEELRSALELSPDQRQNLVGQGTAALDRPLRQELDRILERIEGVVAYEDHEDRFGRIGQAIDVVALRISDLAAQIRDFDRLEEARVDLVRNRLEDQLARALDERVQIEEVEPGALGLQPVEVRLRTASGEKIDCTISIDGTMRIHHYEHVDQASCARSARKLAESLPELMAMRGEPRLDIAASAPNAEAAAGRPGATDTTPAQRKPVE